MNIFTIETIKEKYLLGAESFLRSQQCSTVVKETHGFIIVFTRTPLDTILTHMNAV
jgi:hypothetical protein